MPSGAKKRKAAKRKKEQEAHLKDSTKNAQGADEVKSHDEKDSDSGGSCSPVHQENHDHDRHFGGTEREERDPSAVASFSDEKNSMGEVVNGGFVIDELELKMEESYANKDVNIQNAELVKESNNSDGASSSLNLVDESGMPHKNLLGEASKSVSETLPCDNSVTIVDSSTFKVTPTDIPFQEAKGAAAVTSAVTSSVELVVPFPELCSQVTDNNIPAEKPAIDLETGSSAVPLDLKLKQTEDNMYGNVNTSEVKQRAKGYVSEELPSPNVTVTEMRNSDEHGEESKTPECSERQALLESAPQEAHRTSWLSCCGLFEVLSGSNK